MTTASFIGRWQHSEGKIGTALPCTLLKKTKQTSPLASQIASQLLGVDAQGLKSLMIHHPGLGRGSAFCEGQASSMEVNNVEVW